MVMKKEMAAKLAGQLAEETYGPEGLELEWDKDEFEDLVVVVSRAAFDAVIARALEPAEPEATVNRPSVADKEATSHCMCRQRHERIWRAAP